ncbi:MAG: non-heme iron oxygenase ferredoxin subunit [Gammaproteobacteria bacterium]|nr:non-heme iron oxygenase ferredoxin subunit [Gammaproteobacteria bacterium]MDA7962259.1 non-heme iron oxygenase ferredoxin subunit [Gammaproteobacteria bacterium]MDA7969821.1 non-heme iron oxygenase ferredoxin subunit [Gammaproteobacteria bacterium]MDA7995175.1 non-heme iron oxygenase ferredoxin subunit [Gammaproteobacteria bacterium]CAJ2376908.1 MAG: Ferredoxin, 2Fe-2S [Arenicellales bacterium IbO2]
MSDWIPVIAACDLPPGEHSIVEIDGARIAVFNLDGEFCAIEDVCTHDGSEIASGCIVDGAIECPRHGARFDLKTGAVTAPPAYEPVAVFPLRVEDGVVQVRDDRWD